MHHRVRFWSSPLSCHVVYDNIDARCDPPVHRWSSIGRLGKGDFIRGRRAWGQQSVLPIGRPLQRADGHRSRTRGPRQLRRHRHPHAVCRHDSQRHAPGDVAGACTTTQFGNALTEARSQTFAVAPGIGCGTGHTGSVRNSGGQGGAGIELFGPRISGPFAFAVLARLANGNRTATVGTTNRSSAMIWLQRLGERCATSRDSGRGCPCQADPLSTAQHRIGPFQRQNRVIC